MVTDRCPCGCPTVSFSVDTSAAGRATFCGNPLLPVEAETGEGENFKQLILFARDGLLESLELVYYGDNLPQSSPSVRSFGSLIVCARRRKVRLCLGGPRIGDPHGSGHASKGTLCLVVTWLARLPVTCSRSSA
jgi:hypothetical protein